MLKFLHLGAALAILSTQVTNSAFASESKHNTNEWQQASTAQLLVTGFTADSDNDTLEAAQKIDSTTILGLAALGGGVAIALSAKKAKDAGKLSSRQRFGFKSSLDEESTIRIEQASRKLQKKLLRLLHDERDTANRLLSQAKLKNPNKSVDWYVEKVIYDLQRDRGGY